MSLARAAFVGLTVRHGFPHLTRAGLEGVSFGLRDSFKLMKSAGLANITQVRVTGGGARSPLWRQILADVFGAEIVTVNRTGAGVFDSVESACDATIQITGATRPGKDQLIYEKLYPFYRELYPALTLTFHA
jgi:xylulokinase